MTNPKVTIVSISYNQENFIRQTLESFVMQKTDFPFQVIISDDCSTDNTASIIKEYEANYPDIIKPIFRKKNLGAIKNFIATLSDINTQYVIYNEGDDYFSDPLKLQKQVDFLDNNQDCSICFHPVTLHYENNEKPDEIFPHESYRFSKTKLSLADLIKRNFMQTNSVMYRWRYRNKKLKDILPGDMLPCDWYLHLLHAQVGDIGFIDENMAVYRKHAQGIWWECVQNEQKHHLKYGILEINFYYNVYKNISNKSQKYYQEHFLPVFFLITDIYKKNKDYDKLKQIYLKYPKFITYIISSVFSKIKRVIQYYYKINL